MPSDTSFLYIEVNLVCVLICGIILLRCLNSIDKRKKARLFCCMIICFEVNFLSDLLWQIVDIHRFTAPIWLHYFINCLYFSFGTLGAYFWFMYSEVAQGSWITHRKQNAWLAAIPALLLITIVVSSVKTGWVFSIDADSNYQRGPLHLWHLGISFSYALLTSGKAFTKAFQKKYYDRKNELLALSSFMLLPLVFIFLQVFFGGDVPTMCVGYTVTLLVVYLNIQDQRVTTDPLTQVYNREQMVRYLSNKLHSIVDNSSLFLLMLDADNFKHINDQYGHVEGDAALVRIAEALKKAVPRDAFIGRYGGDEFIIIGNATDAAQIRTMVQDIHLALRQANEEAHAPYDLDISIGCALQTPDYVTIPDFIRAADAELYKIKREKKRTS